MAFLKDQLLLAANKVAQLTGALATPTVADPLQSLCDEAAADVARMTTGYIIDDVSTRNFVRSLALYRIYGKAGPIPPDVKTDHDDALKELQAIAEGKRPSLPRTPTAEARPASGKGSSKPYVPMRTET